MKIKKSLKREMHDVALWFSGTVATKETAKAFGVSRKEAYGVAFGIGAGIALALDMLRDGVPKSEDEYDEIMNDALMAYPEARDKMLALAKGIDAMRERDESR